MMKISPRAVGMSGPAMITDSAKTQAVVLYDGDCAFCQKSVRILKSLDWLHRLKIQDARDTDNWPRTAIPLDLKRMLEEMHVVTPDRRRVYAGFSAFRWIAWRLPATLIIAPLLYLPGIPWLGNRVYRWIARHRYQLVPCSNGECRLPIGR